MRHATKPICSIKVADRDDLTPPMGWSRMLGGGMVGDNPADLVVKMWHSCHEKHDGNCPFRHWRDLNQGAVGKIRPSRHLIGKKYNEDLYYAVRRRGIGRAMSYGRWKERVVARMERCPEELLIALHANLVQSIEL